MKLEVTWEQFERALIAYRDTEFVGRSPISGENAYLSLLGELANVPIVERVAHINSLVLFLNRWRCHFPTEESRAALASWLDREAPALQSLTGLSILDPVKEYVVEFDRLYDSLIGLRRGNPRISTIGDACASKLLHQMAPTLFVMWDSKIKSGFESYGLFMVDMHRLAQRLRDELAPNEARADIEDYLQHRLGYPVRKPLAKYIDEYNWWSAWPRPIGKPRIREDDQG